MRGNAIAKFQSGQKRRAEAESHHAIEQRDRRIDGGDGTKDLEQAQACSAEPRRGESKQRQREEDRGDGRNGGRITADTKSPDQARRPFAQRQAKADGYLEVTASSREEM